MSKRAKHNFRNSRNHFLMRFTEGDEMVDFTKIEGYTPKLKGVWVCPSCGLDYPDDSCSDNWGCLDSQCMH
jgi:hypothetical protein